MERKEKLNLSMLFDFYEMTMANGYFRTGMQERITYFVVAPQQNLPVDIQGQGDPPDGRDGPAGGMVNPVPHKGVLRRTERGYVVADQRAFASYNKGFVTMEET